MADLPLVARRRSRRRDTAATVEDPARSGGAGIRIGSRDPRRLYSFEVQQPATATSKLAGLREHYAGTVGADGQRYFVEHALETDEPAMLAARIEGLSDREFARAKTACAIQRRRLGRPRRGLLHLTDRGPRFYVRLGRTHHHGLGWLTPVLGGTTRARSPVRECVHYDYLAATPRVRRAIAQWLEPC